MRAEEHEYIVELAGTIVRGDEGEPEVEVGRVSAYVLQAGTACNDGESIIETADMHSQQLAEVAGSSSTRDEEAILESMRDGVESDVLFLSSVTLLPPHRGLRLGHLAVQRTIDMFGDGCGIAVLKPFPMQQNQDMAAERRSKLALDSFDTTRNAQRPGLRSTGAKSASSRSEATPFMRVVRGTRRSRHRSARVVRT